MELATLMQNAGVVVGEVGSTFKTLTTDFGYVVFIPMTLAFVRAMIGIVKSVLFYRRGRRRG